MGNISTATESSFDVLESYFKKYPDVPKETILKQHMLSLGHWFSDAALGASAGALDAVRRITEALPRNCEAAQSFTSELFPASFRKS